MFFDGLIEGNRWLLVNIIDEVNIQVLLTTEVFLFDIPTFIFGKKFIKID